MTRSVSVLGSTGSIGRQSLDVAASQRYAVEALAAGGNDLPLLLEQTREFKPKLVAVRDYEAAAEFSRLVKSAGLRSEVAAGVDGVIEAARVGDVVLNAVTGAAGLVPTEAALKAGKTVALANKETLVAAGEAITRLSRERDAPIIPVDSEHSAIFQCLRGERDFERIYLTASGGPFRGWDKERLAAVTPSDALKHPNWNMGRKITIDSATMMNKGLEFIEAKWLFGADDGQIEVVVHPQSVVHSMVGFKDGATLAQLGKPDMRLPIQYALGYPERLANAYDRLDFAALGSLTFEKPNIESFPCLGLAYEASKEGGYMPAVMNAANEVAVERFLSGGLSFTGIAELIKFTMSAYNMGTSGEVTVGGALEADSWARDYARSITLT